MDTKERILSEALKLFSEKGYRAVHVGDIADAVGIKAPSLYKHYRSKQAIFDACVEVFSKRIEEIRTNLHLPGTVQADISYQAVNTPFWNSLKRHHLHRKNLYWKIPYRQIQYWTLQFRRTPPN